MGVGGNHYGDINTGVIIQQGIKPDASRAALRKAFLARVLKQANQLPLFAGDGATGHIRLAAVYTALMTQGGESESSRSPKQTERFERESSRLSVLDRLNQHRRLVLLGGPGSGKSTFVNFLALCMAGEMLGAEGANLQTLTAPIPAEPGDRDGKPQHWKQGALLPVRVVLRDFASELPAGRAPASAETLWRHIQGRLEQASLGGFADWLHEELLNPGGLILLDGLDEVPEPEIRREQIKQAVQDFADSFSRCRFLATSRTYAYTRQDWKLEGFAEAVLLPFTLGQMQRFVTAWYGHMQELETLTAADAEGKAEVLKRTLKRNERLRELAEQPLLLTLIARVHTKRGGSLPEKREELYDEAVKLLLEQWESLKVSYQPDGSKTILPSLSEWLNASPDKIRQELDKLAFEAHRDQAELKGTADIREERLIMALFHAAANKKPDLIQLKAHLCDRAGLLAAHGTGLYQFPHRTFQEYLTACHLTVDRFPHTLADLLRADPLRWREATLLAAAKVRRGTPEAVWSLVDALCFNELKPSPSGGGGLEPDCWGALLAAQALWETGLAETKPENCHQGKHKRVRLWLQAIVEQGLLPPLDRAIAGRMLSVFGDGRDFDRLIAIPPGEFWMGDDRDNDAKPRHKVHLPEFQIGQYPVTNGQYRRFVQATGRPWDSPEAGKPDRRNHPAIFVTWHDALAYCRWLTEQWREAGRIGPQQEFTLPSEAEWERAAAGPEGRRYPWGDEGREGHANTRELGLGETCAVGLFPQGRSEEACLEMAGNVWEWTRSLWGQDWTKPGFAYPYRVGDKQRENLDAGDDVLRVGRGGSWYHARDDARCAVRYGGLPDGRDGYAGFRVVLVSPLFPTSGL